MSGSEGPSAAGLIENDLARGEKGGYKFTIRPSPQGYTLSAVPTHYGINGGRTYLSGSGMRIHVHDGPEPSTTSDPTLGESPPTQ